MPKPLIELTLACRRPAPERKKTPFDFFLSQGFEAHEIITTELKSLCKVTVYANNFSRAKKTETGFKKADLQGWAFQSRTLCEDDWLHKWKRHFRIAPFGKKFAIVPIWEKKKYRGRRQPLLIDPEAAFGSGMHETTRLMIQLMEPLEGRFESFFDAGTGTGVLSVAAARLGAQKIRGTDLDPGSVKTARLNMRLNGIRGAVMVRSDLTRQRIPGRFDLVAANLISKTLTQCCKILEAGVAREGHLIVSGISLRNLPGFLKDFRPKKLKRVKVVRGRSWGAVLFRCLDK